MINAIKANLDGIAVDLNDLAVKVAAGNYAQQDFAEVSRRIATLKASIKALEDHTKKWDGSTSLKNLLKSKAALRAKRDEAVKYLNGVKQAAAGYQDILDNLQAALNKFVPGKG
ncbi:MAG TPA: hypothetical protein VME43_19695 [Bryobacteraceae bacterium]|nr:hypothetical protein [Bryobacteraceae bacterium]